MTLLETHARRRQPVEVGRLIRLASVGGDALVPKIIRHDQDDIRLRSGGGGRANARGERGEDDREKDERTAEEHEKNEDCRNDLPACFYSGHEPREDERSLTGAPTPRLERKVP